MQEIRLGEYSWGMCKKKVEYGGGTIKWVLWEGWNELFFELSIEGEKYGDSLVW